MILRTNEQPHEEHAMSDIDTTTHVLVIPRRHIAAVRVMFAVVGLEHVEERHLFASLVTVDLSDEQFAALLPLCA
jgi:hypothetical protein